MGFEESMIRKAAQVYSQAVEQLPLRRIGGEIAD